MSTDKDAAIERVSALQQVAAENVTKLRTLRDKLNVLFDADSGVSGNDALIEQLAALKLVNQLASNSEAIQGYYDVQLKSIHSATPPPAPVAQPAPAPAPAAAPVARQVRTAPSRVGRSQEEIRRDNASRLEALEAKAVAVANAAAAAAEKRASQGNQTEESQERVRQAQEKRQREIMEDQQSKQRAFDESQPAPLPVIPPRTRNAPPPTQVTARGRVLNAYDRLMTVENSPLTKFFAPAPWFPEGRGNVTVGSVQEFGAWNPSHEVDPSNFQRTATLPSGFYGDKDGMPTCAVIRLHTIILVWYFGFGEGQMLMFHSTILEEGPDAGKPNQRPEDLVFRPIEACPSSSIRRCLEELGQVYGMSVRNGLVIESAKD